MYDTNGDTALTIACKQSNNGALIKIMIDNGANVNHTDTNNFSPLYHAIFKNNIEAVELLIAKGCNKFFNNSYWYTKLA